VVSRRQVVEALAAAGITTTAGSVDRPARQNPGEGGEVPDGDGDGEDPEPGAVRYVGALSARPPPGQPGRVWETPDGSVYLDDGESWELVDREVESLTAGEINNLRYVRSASDLRSTVESLDVGDDPVSVVVTDDLRLSAPLDTRGLPHQSVIRGWNAERLTFTHERDVPCLRFDSQSRILVSNLALRATRTPAPIVEFVDGDYVPNKIAFDRVAFEPLGGGVALASMSQPWGMLVSDCDFRYLDRGGGEAYVMTGGVNNTFVNCIFSHVPADAFAVRPSPGASAQSWVFLNCTFGGFGESDGGGVKGVDYGSNRRISPVAYVGTSFEGLSRDGEGFAVETAGNTSFQGCWFRDLQTAVRLGYQGAGALTAIENCRFDEKIRDVDIDASNRWQQACVVRPLRCARGSTPSLRAPDGGVFGEQYVADGSIDIRDGTATVGTGVESETATFRVDVSGPQGVDHRVVYDDETGTHRVEFEATGPGPGPGSVLNYLIVQTRP
jgi:hypothetical protein